MNQSLDQNSWNVYKVLLQAIINLRVGKFYFRQYINDLRSNLYFNNSFKEMFSIVVNFGNICKLMTYFVADIFSSICKILRNCICPFS